MPEQSNIQSNIAWEIPELVKHKRSLSWYIISFILGALLLVYSIATSNFLFAIIIVLIVVVMILSAVREPKNIKFELGLTGVKVDTKNYNYNQFKNFAIVYQPPEVNSLYLEFKMPFRERLSVPMGEMNPNNVRTHLAKFIEEDLEREDETLSDILSRILKL